MAEKITEETISPDELEQNPSVGSFIWELARVVIVAFGIMLLFRFFVAEPYIVSGQSMLPNFHNNEYLIVNKVGYRFDEPQRGDAIVFKYPKDTSQYFIKRIIGLPGEKVRLAEGRVIIYNTEHPQGQVLDEPYLPNPNITFGRSDTVTLGSEEYFVLGDNRQASSDSRVWGILPKHDIVGKAWLRVFPLNEFGVIRHPDLNF
jgi:signal peptidase I